MQLDDLMDEELVSRASAGEQIAQDILIQRYTGMVYRRAKSYFLPGADKEDLLQEGMIGLYEAICNFDSKKYPSFSTFASMCITRQILSAGKHYNRQKHMPLNNSLSLYATQGEDEEQVLLSRLTEEFVPSMEDTLIKQEEYTLLMNLADELLSPLERQVFLLYLQGERYSDIAKHLGRSTNGVDSAIQRVRRKFQNALDEGDI